MGFIKTDSGDSDTNYNPTIYLKENFKLSHESNPYTKEIFIDICAEINGKETIIGELKGRFFIYSEYRGGGVGKHVLDTFEKNIDLFMENNVRYIGLFPDPITDDLEYDSMESMSKEEREKAIKHLKDFYSSLGFVEMKTNPDYMYLDLNHLNLYKGNFSYEVIYQ